MQLKRTLNLGQLAYTAPITIEGQELNVQIDTGSSDFWLASDRCDSSSCQGKEGFNVDLFSDETGLEVGQSLHISNLIGREDGPIVVSNVSFAGTTILGQALLTADDVQNVQLGELQATGVMGLSLPFGSLIQSVLGTSTSGQNNSMTDSARTGSVLPGLMAGLPDGQRFYSLGLQRLPSDGGNGNSTLIFGDYDRNFLPQSAHRNVHWSAVSADESGDMRTWKLIVNDFLLSINGSTVQIPLSQTGALVVTAVLDSGSPLNYASSNFLNAVYGAYNTGPAADGSGEYYLNCNTVVLITVNVGGTEVPIHPLDASLKYSNIAGDGGNSACIGAFQAFPQGVDSDTVGADIVLGAPFLRSVYSMFSCEQHPLPDNATGWCSNPSVALYPLYSTSSPEYQTALADFQKVRVQGEKLGDNSIVAGSTSSSSSSSFGSGAKIAVGVVCGLLGIIAVMTVLLLYLKRRRSRMFPDGVEPIDQDSSDLNEKNAIHGVVDWNKLSDRERQKARELAMLHGHFVEDPDDGRVSPMPPTRAQEDWDVSSKGYWEARAIVNDYRQRERERDRHSLAAAKSLSGSAGSTAFVDEGGGAASEAHELTRPAVPFKDEP